MYPLWNAYCSPYMMPIPPFLPLFMPQMYANPSHFVFSNHIVSNDCVLIPEITKNTERNTEKPSKSIINISSDSESSIQ